jgi:hypothetical protein
MPETALAMPLSPDTPLAASGTLDLSTASGMALLRRFDSQLRRMGDPQTQRAAVRGLTCQAPLSDRAAGLLVLPGGALALRQGAEVLVCDPASACGLSGPAAATLRGALQAGTPGILHVVHRAEGLQAVPELPVRGCVQAATLVLQSAILAPLLPQAGQWRGPAVIRWCPGGAALWDMVPAPARLALGASVAGESLPADGGLVPPEVWDAPDGDDRYQLLSSGLFAHLDELLGNEVSDLLRYELVDHWTDGEDSLASLLADGFGALPACFATPFDRPAGQAALEAWPQARATLATTLAPLMLLGIAPEAAPPLWRGSFRQVFLRAARAVFALQPRAMLVSEQPGLPPLPLLGLAADRQIRRSEAACAVLAPLPSTPLELLVIGHRVAATMAGPAVVAAPAWGICHRFDPQGGSEAGNAGWYGFGGGLEEWLEEA